MSIDEGIDRLAETVSRVHPWDDLQQATRRLVTELTTRSRLRDDMTLLIARMTGRRKRDIATWRLPARADAAAQARALATTRLRQWQAKDETRDNALLLISELVTNAGRFATGPITVRLIKDGHGLLCEVGDTGNGRPRLGRTGLLDDSGRGLYVVHKVTTHWGVRWTDTGKVVWAELAW